MFLYFDFGYKKQYFIQKFGFDNEISTYLINYYKTYNIHIIFIYIWNLFDFNNNYDYISQLNC